MNLNGSKDLFRHACFEISLFVGFPLKLLRARHQSKLIICSLSMFVFIFFL